METWWGMFGAGGEVSSLAEKKGECHQMQICPPPKKTCQSSVTPCCWRGAQRVLGEGPLWALQG